MKLVKMIIHTLPIVPYFIGYSYYTIALCLLVLLPYIKTFRYNQEIASLEEGRASSATIENIRKKKGMWQKWTFLT